MNRGPLSCPKSNVLVEDNDLDEIVTDEDAEDES
jgi:hypothetical protein